MFLVKVQQTDENFRGGGVFLALVTLFPYTGKTVRFLPQHILFAGKVPIKRGPPYTGAFGQVADNDCGKVLLLHHIQQRMQDLAAYIAVFFLIAPLHGVNKTPCLSQFAETIDSSLSE
ncbi:MAG: hypothetical protein ACLTWO_11825 [Blautia massiliensis (ex Durand et al. 2017)]